MGPLQGIKIIEIAGIGPGQYCGMLLADMGADLIRIDRPGGADLGLNIPAEFDLMNRGRPAIAMDLKSPEGQRRVLELCERADAIFEGFRPGVMERLGLGPDACMERNPKLVYGRMTGYGQNGPLAGMAGHDANYIGLAGALHAIGDRDRPPPLPLNLVADFGGGGAILAVGILAALLEVGNSGKGQVVDAAMIDGTMSMMTMTYGLLAGGLWKDERRSNLLDGAAPFARTYETADGRFVVVCALEGRFYASFLWRLGIEGIDPARQYCVEDWPVNTEVIAARFQSRTRDEWSEVFAATDGCVTPVLSLHEVPEHVHSRAREAFVTIDGIQQPAPAPRFSRTRSTVRHGPRKPGANDRDVLRNWGIRTVADEC